ncbi:hypothetical protein D3877_27420 [Azospirillum cavernae]|uniref:Uncharacterized protein n=1 Tax=Azospirillum cavernae TaxID=2320860 RepID=A0A418VN48_9PROT|nr:hypothetical protein D3877_27420 [Azospirillum cavernae]
MAVCRTVLALHLDHRPEVMPVDLSKLFAGSGEQQVIDQLGGLFKQPAIQPFVPDQQPVQGRLPTVAVGDEFMGGRIGQGRSAYGTLR